MRIRRESVNHYVLMMKKEEPFSFAGYSDAEWRCMFGGEWTGTVTGLGQVIDPAHGRLLLDVLRRRNRDPRWMTAVPRCLWPHEADGKGTLTAGQFHPGLPGFAEGQVDWLLGREGLDVTGWERDDVLDDLARDGGLFPWIKQFQRHLVCLIGPPHLRDDRLKGILNWRYFVPVSTPNLHREPGGIDAAVGHALRYGRGRQNVVYLVSAGVSAAVIIDRLHDEAMRCSSWCLDMGSVWDGFVRAGGQRAWRAELYADPTKHAKWVEDCTMGKDRRGW